MSAPFKPLLVRQSGSQLPSVELVDATPAMTEAVESAMRRNSLDDPVYQLRCRAGAFLQCSSPGYLLIEFWQPDHEAFVAWLNQQLTAIPHP